MSSNKLGAGARLAVFAIVIVGIGFGWSIAQAQWRVAFVEPDRPHTQHTPTAKFSIPLGESRCVLGGDQLDGAPQDGATGTDLVVVTVLGSKAVSLESFAEIFSAQNMISRDNESKARVVLIYVEIENESSSTVALHAPSLTGPFDSSSLGGGAISLSEEAASFLEKGGLLAVGAIPFTSRATVGQKETQTFVFPFFLLEDSIDLEDLSLVFESSTGFEHFSLK